MALVGTKLRLNSPAVWIVYNVFWEMFMSVYVWFLISHHIAFDLSLSLSLSLSLCLCLSLSLSLSLSLPLSLSLSLSLFLSLSPT